MNCCSCVASRVALILLVRDVVLQLYKGVAEIERERLREGVAGRSETLTLISLFFKKGSGEGALSLELVVGLRDAQIQRQLGL